MAKPYTLVVKDGDTTTEVGLTPEEALDLAAGRSSPAYMPDHPDAITVDDDGHITRRYRMGDPQE